MADNIQYNSKIQSSVLNKKINDMEDLMDMVLDKTEQLDILSAMNAKFDRYTMLANQARVSHVQDLYAFASDYFSSHAGVDFDHYYYINFYDNSQIIDTDILRQDRFSINRTEVRLVSDSCTFGIFRPAFWFFGRVSQ